MQAGRKQAKAVDLMFGKASTGTSQVAITFEILDGADVGEFITWIGYLTEKSAKYALKALAVCGAPRGKGLDELGVDDLSSLVSIVVEFETDKEGKSRPKVQWVNRPGHGGFKMKHAIEGAELRMLSAELKAEFDQTERYEPIPIPEPSAKPTAPPPPSEENPPQADHPFAAGAPSDDIPF